MKYCPECGSEYRDEAASCSDCETGLISEEEYLSRRRSEEQEQHRLEKEEFVPVKVAENAFEADRIRAALQEEGIAVNVNSFQETAFDGLFVGQKGWARIEVPRSDRGRAERIVEDLCRAFPKPPDQPEGKEELPDEATDRESEKP